MYARTKLIVINVCLFVCYSETSLRLRRLLYHCANACVVFNLYFLQHVNAYITHSLVVSISNKVGVITTIVQPFICQFVKYIPYDTHQRWAPRHNVSALSPPNCFELCCDVYSGTPMSTLAAAGGRRCAVCQLGC